MPQLVGLILLDCFPLKISDFLDILESLRRLKLLDIRESFMQNDYRRVLNAIAAYGTELVVLKIDYFNSISYASLAQMPNLKNLVFYKSNQELKIPHSDNLAMERIEAISQLKELKVLDLNYADNVNDDALRKLCDLKKLQKIAIHSLNITNKGMLELLYNCKNLRYVNIQDCCKIDTDFITDAIKILEERRDTLREPVEFYVYTTSISKAAVTNMPDCKAAVEAGLIKVEFDPLHILEDFTNDLDDV